MDFSFQNNEELFDEKDYLKNAYFNNSSFRKISKSLILNIVKARLDEVFEMIKKQIIGTGLNSALKTNLFIVGGGSNLYNLDKYCSNFFGSNVKKIGKNNTRESESEFDENFASCFGALTIIKDGWETEAISEPVYKHGQKISFFSKIFGNSP